MPLIYILKVVVDLFKLNLIVSVTKNSQMKNNNVIAMVIICNIEIDIDQLREVVVDSGREVVLELEIWDEVEVVEDTPVTVTVVVSSSGSDNKSSSYRLTKIR